MRGRRLRLGPVVVAALAALAACTGGDAAIEPLPPPPTTVPLPSTTAPRDYTAASLPPVPTGRTTTTAVALGPGRAGLEGKVLGPDGTGVEAATVRVERMVAGAQASTDVATGPDGGWVVPNLLGGSYRVRAWRVPDLSMLEPALFFLGAAETTAVELRLERFAGLNPTPAVAPNPPVVGQPAAVVIQVTSRSVDAQGVVQGTPLAGAALGLSGAGWTITSTNPATTDAGGQARWDLVCEVAGEHPLRLLVAGTDPFNVALPACVPPPPDATAPSAPTASPPATTRPPTTATATTRPPTTRPRR